eukprot:g19377.t1
MGPSSALYGAGSPGGLVNLVSKRAQKGQFTRFGVGISDPEGLELRLDANRKLNEAGTVFGRIVMLGRMSKTQVNHVEDDRVYVAPSLTWAPQEGTELTLLAQYQSDETGTVTSFLPYEATVNTASFGRVPRDFFTGDTNFDSYERRQMMVGYSFSHAFDNGLKFSQDARFSKVEVDYRTLYGAGLASSYFPSMPDQLLVRQLMATGDQVSSFQFDNRLETEFSTGQVDHSLLVGLDYRYEDFRNRAVYGGDPSGNYFVIDITDPHYGIAVTAPAYTTNSTTKTRRTGIYLQDQMTVGGHTDVWAGLRYDWVSAKTTNHLTGGRTDADYSELTGRIGVSHELRDGMRLYASYATSFDPVPNFDPETAEQYEIGLKYETADGGLRFSGAVFDLARQNVVTNHPTRGREQTGETRSRGLELQAQGDLGNGWQAVAALTAMKLEVTQTSEPSELGNVPVGVPETMASLWLTREFGGRLEGLRIGGGVRYTGTSHADKGNEYAVPAYTVADLGLGPLPSLQADHNTRNPMSGSDTAATIEIALAVERLAIMFSQYRPEAVRTFGVSSQQAIILAAIYDEPGCGVKRITERTGMFQPVVSRSLGSLVRLSLLERRRSSTDARATELHLTEAGRRAVNEIRDEWRGTLQKACASLSEEQAAALMPSLSLVLTVAQQLVNEA